jgi:hypothetical protein
MKEYPIEKLVNVALSFKNLNKMSNFATAKAGKDVRVLAHPDNTCYSAHDYWTGMNIKLGRTFYQSTFDDKAPVPVADLKEKYIRVATILFGAYYHELFHVLFTPFQYCYTLTSSCNPAFRNFAHQVSNVLEDITIEGTGCNRYPFAQHYIDTLAECFKRPEQLDMLRDAITNEPTNPGTMIAYLLHFCRETDLSSLPEYKLWKDNKEFIEWGAYKCINTIEPHLRTKRQMAYALELCKILEMKEPDKNNVENPDVSNLGEQSQGLGGSDGGRSGKGAQATKPMQNLTDTATQGPRNNNPQESDEDAKIPESELKQQKAERGNGSGSDGGDPLNSDLTKEGITMLANDDPVSRYSHYADRLDKYIKTTNNLPEYNKIVAENETQIRNVVAIIRKMYATNNASWSHYKMTGRLDSSTFYKKGNYKIFKKKNAPAPTADLVFEILVDNSGSMHGRKAKLAGKALIIFCEALNRLHIPFSVDAFTEANAAITIKMKDYDESYDRVKTNMTLFTQQFDVDKLCTWAGNIDEINLRYVADELQLRKEKDKVLIVISDGATCGDWKTLKHVAESIEQKGTTILGVGIFDRNVEDIYSKHTVIREQEDLEKLGVFLNKYLIGKIFK